MPRWIKAAGRAATTSGLLDGEGTKALVLRLSGRADAGAGEGEGEEGEGGCGGQEYHYRGRRVVVGQSAVGIRPDRRPQCRDQRQRLDVAPKSGERTSRRFQC